MSSPGATLDPESKPSNLDQRQTCSMSDPHFSSTSSANMPALPAMVDRATFEGQITALRVREKAHAREGDAIAAARRRLPMVEMDPALGLIGPRGPLTLLEAFEGRRQL